MLILKAVLLEIEENYRNDSIPVLDSNFSSFLINLVSVFTKFASSFTNDFVGSSATNFTSNALTSSTFSATLAVLVANLSSFFSNFSTFSAALVEEEDSLTLSFSFLISAMAAAPNIFVKRRGR